MTHRVLVTGASGTLGQELVPRLVTAGYTVRALSRAARRRDESGLEWARGDLLTGEGLSQALAGVVTLVHLAHEPRKGGEAVNVAGTRRLLEQARAAGVQHIIDISIVGIDRIPLTYYRQKLAAEAIVQGGSIPWTILRATQFYPFLDKTLHGLRQPFGMLLVPTDFRFQPIDTAIVAERLVDAVSAGASGWLPDIGGPEVLTLGELARAWLAAQGRAARVIRLPLPGTTAAAFRGGAATVPENRLGTLTWAGWLQQHYEAVPADATPGPPAPAF